ncbi:SusC/RagA family TonB-linked outer membrane protein [Bacteroides oleiciplenus]|uniref:TonB-dependent receptor n=1 Tax=Bacteroides oleiciplenus TaxID=626931 RepID=A0A3E5BSF2_9BACE|nr:TonB-dependent receptor [Bacteroides oleiciplenus]RGN40289.1 TonB-dependent receptor [Bacteroides oleiciplenus]
MKIKQFFILFIFLCLLIPTQVISGIQRSLQSSGIKITGVITDYYKEPIPGATVRIKGTSNGTISNQNGEYTITVPDESAILQISFIGYQDQEVAVKGRKIIPVVLNESATDLDEVVVVGFGTQKKESLVSSISTIKVTELKGPTSNLTTMLSGKIAGVISYQRSGEPGKDDASFFVRGVGSFGAGKVNPLILIDGIESTTTDLSRLQPDDISDFSVLKDATSAAVYGARGANGVILVNTKQGIDGKTRFNFRAENSISTNTHDLKLADNITYMRLANEATLTRNPLGALPYSQTKIDYTKAGTNPYLYPSNNWIDELIKPYTMNQRYNLNVSGGGKIAKYYLAGTFNIDNGNLRNNKINSFDNNIKLKNYSIRSNTNLQLTRTTEAIVRVYGQFDDYSGPIGGGETIYNAALWANPVAFPAYYPSSYSPYTTHPMFGSDLVPGTTSTLYVNPYAKMVSGYQQYNTSTFQAQIEFKQNFDFILPGLSMRVMGYTQRYSYFDTSRNYNPFYYTAYEIDGTTYLNALNDGSSTSIGTTGTEYLSYSEGAKQVSSTYYGEAALNYNHTFKDKHAVSGMLIGLIRHSIVGNAGSLEASLPARNLGLSGRFTYTYDQRYLTEFNFGYNGSERFSKNNRWGFFPSIGLGWIISHENFFEPLSNVFSNFKIRGSYGLIGNDQIGNSKDRFFYMSNVNLSDSGKGYTFGEEFSYWRPGVSTSRYANYQIGWEESRQMNLGLDFTLFDLNATIDIYQQKRSNILMGRSYIPGTMGLQAGISANVGKAESQGIDIALDYNKSFNNKTWATLRANFTYATSKVTVYDEPNYADNEWYRSHVGYPINQAWGYIAERLFVDEEEVANSPRQNFSGTYGAGDIKYRDVNGDGQITSADMVPIGYPTNPEINYGFGGTLGYKQFDFSFFFQGSARSSFFIDPTNISPFLSRTISGEAGYQNGLLKVVADDHWSEDNRNLYAFFPRLSNTSVENNMQQSTWWLRDGSFLRLKSLEIGYNVPEIALKKVGLSNIRIYLNASNIFVISGFKLWDPEMGGKGLGYPIQRTFNIGINLGI